LLKRTRIEQHSKIVIDTLVRFATWKAQNCGEVVLFHASPLSSVLCAT